MPIADVHTNAVWPECWMPSSVQADWGVADQDGAEGVGECEQQAAAEVAGVVRSVRCRRVCGPRAISFH